MTQDPNASATSDALIARYQAAQAALDAHDASGPSSQTRVHILDYAAKIATNSRASHAINHCASGPIDAKKPASNDRQWKIRALATVAMFGLTSLLLLQWDRGTPEEKEVAFSAARPPIAARPGSATTPAPAAPAAAPAAPEPPKAALPSDAAPGSKDAAESKPAVAADQQGTSDRTTEPKPSAKIAAPKGASSKPPKEDAAVAESIAPPTAKAAEYGATQSMRREDTPSAAARMNKPEAADAESSMQDKSAVSARRAATLPNAALFAAIRSSDAAAVQQALANGADKNAKSNGTPAITLCVQSGKLNLVQLLAAAGADLNAPDAQGISPLAHAQARGLDAMVRLLLELGAK